MAGAHAEKRLAPRAFLAFDDFSLAGQLHNAAIQENEYWALADALVTLVSDAEALVIAAALHLPYAKPLSATMTPIANVYHSVLNAASSPAEAEHRDRDGPVVTFGASASSLAHVDSSWEIKDKFLSMLVHFLKVEQSPRTHFLLAKGYKPGRDHAGTYEAVDSLVAAVEAFTNASVAFDTLTIKTQLPRKLADAPVNVNAQHENDHHTLLYH
uniref:Uncharacterized protein n=1 Tax=Globisporangium ultimum (strain ATCC 200006 / CBS 805.95 / DAOM BR144) TaxID=431595 RepID=K3W687_GLOUD